MRNAFEQMTSYGIFAVLFVSVGVATAIINCYSGSNSDGSRPKDTQPCDSQYCTRIFVKLNGVNTYNYGCDQTQLCKSEGRFVPYGDSEVYCCSWDLCNSSSKFSALFALFIFACFSLS
ncbi:unnamed protein product [Cylicocyclus nassatus]|uniref:Uncharacterized protein n=1 Tax=Cylicocyclus nassatus TaxID=53992 RepID=A0AA36H7T1_CYLNA|nr:unnamed protein product [Cylicocyclus nassatus]